MMGYRRLPGRLRGVVLGASVWVGSDHLLAVRSMRFREEYKRFYLRDVQAIAVARKPRFHLPSWAIIMGLILAWFYITVRIGLSVTRSGAAFWADVVFWMPVSAYAIWWIVVSSLFSCKCRIYTAVSCDDLPSVHRTWTARRFLAAVEPLISQVQGVIEGDWSSFVESNPLGPVLVQGGISPEASIPVPAVPNYRTTPSALVFVALLLGDAFFSGLTLQSTAKAVFWGGWAFTLLRVIAAILIFIEQYRGLLRPAMKKLAILSLVCTGLLYYLQQITPSLARIAQPGSFTNPNRPLLLGQIDIVINAALGIAGLIILLRGDGE